MVRIHATCQLLANRFNQANISGKEIQFIQIEMIKFIHREPACYGIVEDYIPGNYKKFNNNGNWKKDEDGYTAQAFSHFSHEISGKNLIIVDLQGVKKEKKYVLTDPAIHSVTEECYGSTDRNRIGIDEFFRAHQCNKICKKLNLRKNSEQTNVDINADTVLN